MAQMLDTMQPADTGGERIDLTRDVEVAYWCRLFDIDHAQLRRAIQQVGPRAPAVARYLRRSAAASPQVVPGTS
jgi:hypothetical protein